LTAPVLIFRIRGMWQPQPRGRCTGENDSHSFSWDRFNEFVSAVIYRLDLKKGGGAAVAQR
jgi:hypothetical protein